MLRVAAVTAAALSAFAVSCFSKPGAPNAHGDGHGQDPEAGAGMEAGMGSADASVAACGTHDFFTATMPVCGSWGAPFGQTNLMNRVGGRLEVHPGPTGSAGCDTTASFKFGNGASIEIPQPAFGAMPEDTFFMVRSEGSAASYIRLDINTMMTGSASAPMMTATCGGAITGFASPITYDANHHWIRFAAITQQDVAVFTSADGISYTRFGTLACAWSDMVANVFATFGVMAPDTTQIPAQFDNFNTVNCPAQ